MTHGNSTSALNHSLGSLFEPELGSQRFSRRRGTLGLPVPAENHVSIVVVRKFPVLHALLAWCLHTCQG